MKEHDVIEAHVERVLLWMVSGLAGNDLENAVVGKLGVEPTEVHQVIAEARMRQHLIGLALAAEAYPLREHARLAVERIKELEAAAS